jgi:type VI secretion system protein ImpA
MSSVDIDQLLTPITDEMPAGDDLEYDPEYGELVLAAQRKPEQRMGDQFIPAVEPDWTAVFEKSTTLFSRSKDYRIAVNLTNAAFQKDGFAGLADGLSVIRLLTEQFWDGVYPLLDAEDNNDPSFRVNALIALNDENGTLGLVRSTPMVESRAMGKFSLRDYLVATGDLATVATETVDENDAAEGNEGNGAGDSGPPQISHIDAAFMDVDIDDLQLTQASIERAAEEVSAVSALLTDLVGTMDAPDLDPLSQELWQVNNVLVDHLARRGVGDGIEAADDSAGESGGSVSGQINSRDDALLMLDRICDYFARHEPSSPVPLLLRRAKRLVAADFLEILKDMTPDGVHQAESIAGVQDSES